MIFPTYTEGTVAVSTDVAGRFSQFTICMSQLLMPLGSKTMWQVGSDTPGQRNAAVKTFHGDWLWFMDDDHTFREDVLMSLLAHIHDRDGVNIVAPVVLRRQQPFRTVTALNGDIMSLTDMPGEGLITVEATGSAGMLIRREVFENVPEPWFELGNGVSEDIAFCKKAREAGYEIHVDLGLRIGHITTCVVWPVYDEKDGWITGFTIADGAQLAIEAA